MNPGTDDSPVLSICVPTFNRARYLECLLQSISASIGELGLSYELLISDNASEDDTADVVKCFESLLNIRYFRRPVNLGSGPNILQLYRAARGRYILYLADDDLLILSALGSHIAYLEANPDVGAVFAPWFMHDRASGLDFDQFYSISRKLGSRRRDMARCSISWSMGISFPRSS